LFQVQGPSTLNGKEDFCYDLSSSDIYKELTDEVYTLKSNKGKVCGIAYTIESYGLITNLKLLKKAGYNKNDINSFSDLKRISEDITSRQKELGFAAFCSSGMDNSSNWRFVTHLSNMPLYFEYKDKNLSIEEKIEGKYISNYKAIWDLYINNSTCEPKEISAKTADDARNEFLAEKAVFYQNGSWEFANLVSDKAFKSEDIAMLPIFIGVGEESKQGLCTGTENFWCVNQKVSKSDIKATLDFINWCVTSEEGTEAMAKKMGFVIPFKKALKSDNVFVIQNDNYSKEGKTPVPWSFTTIPSQEWKNMLNTKLTIYAAEQNEENWKHVSDAFINNWEKEYKLANGQ
jgi:raffinose/stachyose/melibiose transport system substrate-binding protein